MLICFEKYNLGTSMDVTFANQLGIDVSVLWINSQGVEIPAGTVSSFSDLNLNTFR